VLVLPAELTHAQATACCRMLAQALRTEPGAQAVADASALRQFDSSALAVLLECRREALALGKTFAVSQLHPRLRALATLYGVAELLPEVAPVAA
jgi:phospholipid transport system transporter-binding protein